MMAGFTNRNHRRVHEISRKPAHGSDSTKPGLYQSRANPLDAVALWATLDGRRHGTQLDRPAESEHAAGSRASLRGDRRREYALAVKLNGIAGGLRVPRWSRHARNRHVGVARIVVRPVSRSGHDYGLASTAIRSRRPSNIGRRAERHGAARRFSPYGRWSRRTAQRESSEERQGARS